MSRDHDTLLLMRLCELRWPSRHVAGLARLLTRPKSTAAAWLSGRRHMQADTMALLADVIRDDGRFLTEISRELAEVAAKKRSELRRPRGFQLMKDWDNNGSISDRRWRGGRSPKQRPEF
jgi:hypothetical protein